MKRYLAENKIRFYIVDAYTLAEELGLGNHINLILQAAFFKLSNIMPLDDAILHMKEAAKKTYAKKGQNIVEKNFAAIDAGISNIVEITVPEEWKNAVEEKEDVSSLPAQIRDIVLPINQQKGDKLPVSAFVGHESGTYKMGTTVYEKEGLQFISLFGIQVNVSNVIAALMCARMQPFVRICSAKKKLRMHPLISK